MRILVDIIHPAHVHFFKYAIWEWEKRGHQVCIVARDKDITILLLKSYDFDFHCISSYGKGLWGLFGELIIRDRKLYQLVRKFKPDILSGIAGVSIAHIGKLIRKPSIVFTDTEHAKLSNKINLPFASVVCTPSCYTDNIGKNQIRYDGYHELAYLHPNRFKPDPTVLKEVGLAESDVFFIIRFVSWGASHDVGQRGFSSEGRAKLINELEKYGRVSITSEGELPVELQKYRMSVSPEKIHDLLYYATMYIGEGGTMASEAAILGTPSIFVNTLSLGYLDELEHRYGLVYSFVHQHEALEKAIESLRDKNIKEKWSIKRRRMLAEKIDVTAFLVDFVERYPESFWEYRTQQSMNVSHP